MIRGLENWRYLLAGTKSLIRILSDHKNLTYWKDGHNIGRRVARWMGILADYNISIEHHPCYDLFPFLLIYFLFCLSLCAAPCLALFAFLCACFIAYLCMVLGHILHDT